MGNKHRHHAYRRSQIAKPWKWRAFRNPRTTIVVLGCRECHPRTPVPVRKAGRIWMWSDQDSQRDDMFYLVKIEPRCCRH